MHCMNINIRRSTKDDWQIVQKLNAEVYKNSEQFDQYLRPDDCYTKESEDDYKKSVTDESKFCMIAEVDGQPAGYIFGGENNYPYRSNKRGEIFHMGTSPAYRSHGIGSILVGEFKKWCKEKGLTHIATSAYFNDPKARNFYEKQGMTPIDVGYEGPIIL